jgi:elongation factor Ts
MSITASQVKVLRDKTGAGMMDCKKALTETGGDEEKAVAWLREKGLAKAAKRAGRATSEGVIGHYIHSNGKLGVMVEIKCETDFVAKSDKFQEFAKNVAMQIAAANPVCALPDDVPQELLDKEMLIYKNQAMEEGKPEHIAEKIVQGRVQKFYKEICLMEQPFIKDDKVTIKDLLNDLVAVLGENIQVGRFARIDLSDSAEEAAEAEEE